ncbi:hypothetical protein Tco_0520769 [Tanacetum coccineum]
MGSGLEGEVAAVKCVGMRFYGLQYHSEEAVVMGVECLDLWEETGNFYVSGLSLHLFPSSHVGILQLTVTARVSIENALCRAQLYVGKVTDGYKSNGGQIVANVPVTPKMMATSFGAFLLSSEAFQQTLFKGFMFSVAYVIGYNLVLRNEEITTATNL